MVLFFLIVVFVIDSCIMFFSVARKDSSRSIYFVLIAAALTVYTAGCILIEMSTTADGVMNGLRISNLGTPFIAPCLLLITLCLFKPKHIKSWMLPVVGVYGLIFFFVILFNDSHHLYYTRIFDEIEDKVKIGHNILFWVQQGISVLCMIPAYIILLKCYIAGNKKLRRQMVYVMIGALVVFISNIMNFVPILPQRLDLMPYAMAIALIFITIDIAKYRLLDIGFIASNTALKTMPDAIIILDRDWCFLCCNDSAKALFPSLESFSETDPITKIRDWPHELQDTDKLGEIIFELKNKENEVNGENGEEGGSKSTYRAITNKIIDERGYQVGWSIIIHDDTNITYLINRLENLAATDPLTGISNRRGFLEKVERELEISKPYRLNISNALIMYDIDWFRRVNEDFGHDGGDHALCAVVEAIKKRLRSYDIIGRYGGEEFVIFMPGTNEDALQKIASELCGIVEHTEIIYKGKKIPVTASFGAVHMPPGADYNEAMLAVDEAMYEAKHNGRNQAVVGVIKKSDT